ncbi:protein-disulfide reductase DsbD domain-containing protein [Shinella pollutisoli]|uniref:Protein-disulfide reductase DsbD domain-containing protein n=1 Tax=Shinella pollutisoli TaxID=2250594 RepID=A0ABV7DCN4_9HYPH|nr:protein-disulfide reductase DsbD domain-containing protein [Shinella pollutisoli]
MTRFRTALAALVPLLLLPPAALAAASAWVATPGGDVRLVALPADASGRVRAMLDIRLHDGWKTYWRDPGGAGIPPALTATGARLEAVRFPVPKRLGDAELHYVGYDAPVALPLTLTDVSGPVTLSVFLGVCKEICIPVQAELGVDPRQEAFANPLEETAIAAAEAKLPPAAAEDLAPLSGRWSADGKTLTVRFRAPEGGGPPEVYVSGPDDIQFGPAGAARRDGEAYVADVPVLYRPKAFDAAAGPVLLAVRIGTRTMEAPLAIE